uniref:NmrA-like domain-containing protein n=1 Tax=Oryza brachyantha TaxID=4533 RepID=J3KVN5_ORYBR
MNILFASLLKKSPTMTVYLYSPKEWMCDMFGVRSNRAGNLRQIRRLDCRRESRPGYEGRCNHTLHSLVSYPAPQEKESMASEKSRILVVGGTGYIGRHVVTASARLGHPTTALVRDTAPSDPAKAQLLQGFRDAGATLLQGDLYDHASLIRAVRDADVVISTLGALQIADQTKSTGEAI